MTNCTRDAREKQTRRRRPSTTMSVEQRQGLIEWAWRYARPVIDHWTKRRPGLDHEGHVAERLSRRIDDFDAGKSCLKTWACNEAHFACRDATREDTGVVHFPRGSGHRPGVMQLSKLDDPAWAAFDGASSFTPQFIGTEDPPGHMERMDAFRELIKGTSRAERILLLEYYWHDRTMKQIGEDLGLSESRISQMHSRLLERLRDRMSAA